MSLYHYKELDENQIRLVKLHPYLATDGPRDHRSSNLSAVRIDIEHVNLAKPPGYTAISYTWGKLKRDVKVTTLDGSTVLATPNVEDVLHRLRPEADAGSSYLWIDQLCIDQENEKDKWQQVRLMRHIYASATSTFLVLRDDDKHFDAVFAEMSRIQVAPLTFIRSQFSRSIATTEASAQLLQQPDFRKKVLSIVNNEVFSRAWIYQELVSSSNLAICSETYHFRWDQFAAIFMLCMQVEAAAHGQGVMRSSNVRSLHIIIDDRITHLSGGHKDWMLLHVETQGLLKCTDPRDNTIALTTFQDFHDRIPDYTGFTAAFLYRAAADSMIRTSKTLDIFAAILGDWHDRERDQEDMPSWVPDWAASRESIPLYMPFSPTSFNAANGRQHRYETNVQKRTILQVRGRKVDHITTMCQHKFEDLTDEADLRHFLALEFHVRTYVDFRARKGNEYNTETLEQRQFLAREFLRVQTASQQTYSSFLADRYMNSPPDVVYEELVFMYSWYQEIMEGQDPLYHDGKPLFLSFMPRTYGNWKGAMAKFRQWTEICVGRRIVFGNLEPSVVTSTERLGFGLVPKKAQGGDEIYILHGSKVPVVLRRVSSRCHRVIGQCYWHGWMDGQNVDWEEDDADSLQLI